MNIGLVLAALCVSAGHLPPPTRQPLRQPPSVVVDRRAVLGLCGCIACSPSPQPAEALAAIARQPAESTFDVARDARQDQGFAKGMATGMKAYEKAVEPTKFRLFASLLAGLPAADAVVVEMGIGTFPNAKYYTTALPRDTRGPASLDIIGIDPNDAMPTFALSGPAVDALRTAGHSLRLIHGVAEALPLADGSADAVVCTLTLCSVPEPARALAEARRVLKPGGRLLFLEHVRSETDLVLQAQQDALTPFQVKAADGCHLNRRTLETIKAAGFAQLDASYFELSGFLWLNPTVAGIAIKGQV